MRCVNERCKEDPDRHLDHVVVNADGDFACSQKCADEYVKQREHFFNNIAPSAERTAAWLNGGEDRA